jgi:hypothetical protein
MYVGETDISTSLAASPVVMYVDETDIITSLAASPVVMYVETFKTDVVVSVDYVIMCLTSHWQIIFSIRVNFMMLTISLSDETSTNICLADVHYRRTRSETSNTICLDLQNFLYSIFIRDTSIVIKIL